MQNIVPNLWFDDQAEQAVERYLELFDETSLGRRTEYNETMAEQSGQTTGALMAQEFTLEGFDFVAFNGGPHFEMNPSISLIVNCPTVEGAEALWQGLTEGGKAMMPLQEYEFSDCYGWCEDAFGVSWQLMHTPQALERLTELLWETDPATSERVAEALLGMQKIDVGALEAAAEGAHH